MATLNTAVQAMVDNLHAKMTSNEPLNGEEQTLMASAIEKLSGNMTWEKALIAVAQEHLNTATTHMTSTLTTATSALSSAESKVVAAHDTLQSQNTNLAMIPQLSGDVATQLNAFSQSNTAALNSQLAGMTKPVFGLVDIESISNSGNHQRSSAVFAVYDANGESYLARPSFATSTSSTQHTLLEYLKLHNDGSGKTVLINHYVHNSTFYQNPVSYIYRYGCTAMLPLALKDDASDIAYEAVYSSQTTGNSSSGSYGGIYCRSAGYTSRTIPKININATDKWGVTTVTNHSWGDCGVLYDNNKHCLVVVDSSTSLLVEKYRNGNVMTDISVANNEALQTYVDNGDFTVVKFIALNIAWPSCYTRYSNGETNTSSGANRDCYGFFGKLNNHTRIGGTKYCSHYRYTADKKLEPLNFIFNSTATTVTTAVPGIGRAELAVTDFNGNTLGLYSFEAKCDSINYYAGYMANAIMSMNPYSNVGIINEYYTYSGSTVSYGIGRTCKAY